MLVLWFCVWLTTVLYQCIYFLHPIIMTERVNFEFIDLAH